MGIRMNLRDRVRQWLGIDECATVLAVVENRKDMQQSINWGRAQSKAQFDELLAAINRLDQRLTILHADAPRQTFEPPVMDWDTVQAVALHALEKENPPKEM